MAKLAAGAVARSGAAVATAAVAQASLIHIAVAVSASAGSSSLASTIACGLVCLTKLHACPRAERPFAGAAFGVRAVLAAAILQAQADLVLRLGAVPITRPIAARPIAGI
jgi:hypothetical protein